MFNLIENIRKKNIDIKCCLDLLDCLNTYEHKTWWMNTKGDHYPLLCWMSEQINNTVIYDLGTFRGMSALALASNPTNKVITYDNIDWSSERVKNPGNIEFIVGDFFQDKDLLNSPFLMVDIDPHNGIIERQFIDWIESNNYKGLVFYDDIHLNDQMKAVWNGITREKYDLTEFGHYSGSGVVIYE